MNICLVNNFLEEVTIAFFGSFFALIGALVIFRIQKKLERKDRIDMLGRELSIEILMGSYDELLKIEREITKHKLEMIRNPLRINVSKEWNIVNRKCIEIIDCSLRMYNISANIDDCKDSNEYKEFEESGKSNYKYLNNYKTIDEKKEHLVNWCLVLVKQISFIQDYIYNSIQSIINTK